MKTSGFQAHPTFLKVFVGQGRLLKVQVACKGRKEQKERGEGEEGLNTTGSTCCKIPTCNMVWLQSSINTSKLYSACLVRARQNELAKTQE